jgi:hypothetical protein
MPRELLWIEICTEDADLGGRFEQSEGQDLYLNIRDNADLEVIMVGRLEPHLLDRRTGTVRTHTIFRTWTQIAFETVEYDEGVEP